MVGGKIERGRVENNKVVCFVYQRSGTSGVDGCLSTGQSKPHSEPRAVDWPAVEFPRTLMHTSSVTTLVVGNRKRKSTC
jgi:hypothetical protein